MPSWDPSSAQVWHITRSEALAAYGSPRQTTDVDVDASPSEVDDLDGQPVVVTGGESKTCWSGGCSGIHDASDPRVSGDLTTGFDSDCWAYDVCTFAGTIAITNEEGSWDGRWAGFRDEKGLHRSLGWMSGRGAYEGWSYMLNLVEPEVGPGIDYTGIVFPGGLPESVASSLPPTE